MAIENTYRAILVEDYVKDQLSRGVSVNAEDVATLLDTTYGDTDLSEPQFVADDHQVVTKTASSASAFRSTFTTIRQDLRALYKELFALSAVNQRAFERWDLEARGIEKQLIDLEDRIENLLLLTQDTEGYHSVLVDNFTDANLIDTDHTTAELDLAGSVFELAAPAASSTSTRLFLNDLRVNEDVSFKVRTTVDMLSRVDATTSFLTDIFAQESKAWWTSVNMRVQKPVTCELNVRLTEDESVTLSRIFIELHDSAESSPIYITPLYSLDNRTFSQVPSTTYTIEARTTAVFSFSPVEAKYIKFLLNKVGPDPSSSIDSFSYQFGFKNIAFFEQTYDTDNPSIFISEPMYALDVNGDVKQFEKLTLETCERVEDDTEINYFIAVSNNAAVPLDSSSEPTDGPWIPISPVQRITKLHPYILNVGDVVATTIGDTEQSGSDTEVLSISYDNTVSPLGDDTPSPYMNPAADFTIIKKNATTGAVETDSWSAGSTVRYTFKNSNERILNFQVLTTGSTGITLDQRDLILFRNVGKRGFIPGVVASQVRNIQRGWRFEDPYYSCVIEIENPAGITIDVGESPIIVDDASYSNVVDNTVLTGKSGIPGDPDYDNGIHTVKVHKNNWAEVAAMSDTEDLAELKVLDTLYPFNHKMLIEGYDYSSNYPATEEKIYTGVDLFAESILTQVSIFDLTTNIATDNYDVYAVDYDAPSSYDAPNDDNDPTLVFVVKVDEENPDFQNERFVLRFTLINELRKYLRLRADLSTDNGNVSPALHSYKIKLG